MRNTKVLLVDDEKIFASNIKLLLEEDFHIETANSADNALMILKNFKPDIVLCDISMPDTDGYEFLKKFRNQGFLDTPFLYLTAKNDYEDIRHAMGLGADDYLTKPIKSSLLREAIHSRLKRKEELNALVNLALQRMNLGFELMTDQEFFEPISTIVSFMGLLKNMAPTISQTTLIEYLSQVDLASKKLNGLFEKLRIWKGLVNQESKEALEFPKITSIKEVLDQKAKQISAKYSRESDLLCNIEVDKLIATDKYFLELLFEEVLDNAFKFSEKGDPVILGATTEKGKYILMIADSGRGKNKTTADSLKNIQAFGKLMRSKKKEVLSDGVGVGLSIVEMIINKMNGELEFSDNQPCGIIVTIRLPFMNN